MIPVFLLPIVLTTANNRIRFREGGTTGNLDLTPGTWFLRGDGAADDLILELETRMSAFGGGGNNYYPGIARGSDPATRHGFVTIVRGAGADSFQLQFGDAATTFDASILGFTQVNTAFDGNAKANTLSPSAQWVSTAPYSEWTPVDQADGYVVRARSGVVRDGITGGPYDVRRIAFSMIHGERWHPEFIAADPDRAFSRFFWRWAAGRPCEVHFAAATGTSVGALSSSTRKGTRWHLGEEARDELAAARRSPATSLWSWSFELWGRVAA